MPLVVKQSAPGSLPSHNEAPPVTVDLRGPIRKSGLPQPRMPQPAALPAFTSSDLPATEDDKDIVGKIRKTHTHEIVIGLCGPIGAPTREVALRLEGLLQKVYQYNPSRKKLSEYIENHSELPINKSDPFSRYSSLILAGNALREKHGSAVLAELAIADIAVKRNISKGSGDFKPERFCHIIDSIKNQQELQALKAVYQELFICIGVFSSLDQRVERLSEMGITKPQIETLIDLDSGEEKGPKQTIKETYHQADIFIDCINSPQEIDRKLTRILDLVLGAKIITPTTNETAMYTAFTAALNSACLSRQVGAAVTDRDGYLLGVGWNDVPRFDGSVYREHHSPDNRCHAFGTKCYNDEQKGLIAADIAERLEKEGLILPAKVKKVEAVVRDARIKHLIEFSRAVHAEMLALLNAGRSVGTRMQGGKIYVTTYPCHACARHIIAAGIHEIYYIEPYRKSLAINLHQDALTENPNEPNKVKLIPFEGVSPSRYADFFEKGATDRKSGGKLIEVDPASVNFKAEASLRSLPMLERMVVQRLKNRKLITDVLVDNDGPKTA